MEIADLVLATLGKPDSLKQIVPDRPGHDRRYLLDSSKLRSQLGWAPQITWEDGLAETVEWYAANRAWWEPLRARAPVVEGGWGPPVEWGRPVRVLVTGADGQLGRDVLDALAGRVPSGGRRCSLFAPEGPQPGLDYEVLATDIGNMRVDDRDQVQFVVRAFRPTWFSTAERSPRSMPARAKWIWPTR